LPLGTISCGDCRSRSVGIEGLAVDDLLQVARYKKSDRDAVFALLRAAHSHPADDRLIRQWDWKYDANPFNQEAEPYVLLLREGSRLIGMLGTLPLRVLLDGKEHWVSHSCDWLLHPDYRRGGLGRQLIAQHGADKPVRFSWQNELSHRSLRHRAPGSYATIFPLVKPLDFTHVLRQVTGSDLLSRCAASVAATADRLTRPRRRTAVADVRLAQVDTFDERFDGLARRTRQDYGAMLVRDAGYLNWRFTRRPDTTYTVLVATRASDLVGYVVLRSAPDQAGVRWGYLVDFLVEQRSRPLFALLLESAVECLQRQGVKGISCRALPPYRRVLYRYGFYPMLWGPRQYFHISINLSDPTVRVLQDVRAWHLTMGDGDLEMAF
jgi:GNAT superfamily N-acetyltransferase